mgnify:CR=1 FL=1
MSGLLGLLDLGSSALLAQQAGIAISGRNTANLGTEGYSREIADLRAALGAPLAGGVLVDGVYRAESSVLSKRERSASGQQGFSDSLRAALSGLEQNLAPQAPTLLDGFSSFFGGLANLAAAPMSDSLRQSVVGDAQALAKQFNRTAGQIAGARTDSDKRIIDLSDEASRLARRIADANHKLQQEMDPVLADERDLAARKLAAIVGGQARVDTDGKMRFVASGGVVLVDGDRASKLVATPDPRYGNHVRIDAVDGVLAAPEAEHHEQHATLDEHEHDGGHDEHGAHQVVDAGALDALGVERGERTALVVAERAARRGHQGEPNERGDTHESQEAAIHRRSISHDASVSPTARLVE